MKPQLGHYRVDVRTDFSDLPRTVTVTPAGGGENFIRLSIVTSEYCNIMPLTAAEARKIAQGLLVSAERLDHPLAVAGPE